MDDEVTFLDCPRCAESVPESTYEMLHFDCPACGLNFDMAVCENCGEWIGVYWSDKDICPMCGEKHTS